MITSDIKGTKVNLINWINNLSDPDLLHFLEGLRVSMDNKDGWNELSTFEKKQILAGLKDAEEGKVIDSQTFWNNLTNG
jgi:hypothetical protein